MLEQIGQYTQQPTAAGPSGGSGARETLSSDFETFLRMMTVQVQNQDPLNPVDATDYATQLATFAGVEQQVQTNDLLRDLGAALGGSFLQQAGQWIGMEALVRAPARFDGAGSVTIRPDPVVGADNVSLVVRAESGAVIERLDIDPSAQSVIWTGLDQNGNAHPAGNYRFELESYKDDSLVETKLAELYSRIEEVRSDDGQVMIRLADGTDVLAGLINGLRAPQEGVN